MNLVIKNPAAWQELINSLPSTTFVALTEQDGVVNGPDSYPCVAKIARSRMNDADGSSVDAFIIMLFYKQDANALLGIERSEIEGYKYAQAL